MTPRCGSCLSYRPRSEVYGLCWEPANSQMHADGRVACYPVIKAAGSQCEHFRDRIANRAEVDSWRIGRQP